MVTDFRTLDVSDPLQQRGRPPDGGEPARFPVLDSDRPIGILTRAELVMALQQHGTDVRVGDVIRPDDEYVDAGEPLEEAIQRMREQSRTALPVLQHGGLVGLITLENVGDLLVVQDALQRHAAAGGDPAPARDERRRRAGTPVRFDRPWRSDASRWVA